MRVGFGSVGLFRVRVGFKASLRRFRVGLGWEGSVYGDINCILWFGVGLCWV